MSSLAESIGRHIASLRAAHGLTLDNIATEGRKWGMTWTTTSIRNFEAGKFALTLQNLTGLATALSKLTGTPLRISDLLGDAADVGEGFPQRVPAEDIGHLTREWLEEVLRGEPVAPGVSSYTGGEAWSQQAMTRAIDSLKRTAAELPRDLPFDDIPDVEPTLAERRAAERLGKADHIVAVWARHLWGRSLDDEAGARAGDGASPQARGYVTRGLVAELRERMEQDRGDD